MVIGRLPMVVVGFVALIVSACATPAPQAGQSGPAPERGAPAQSSSAPKQLVVAILQEPSGWAPWGANTTAGGTLQVPVFARRSLTLLDDKGTPQAAVAVSIPTVESGDWQINPDGSMDQTWKIRPDARWHDGQPVTAEDFVFGWEVNLNPQLGVVNPEIRLVTGATAPDPSTLILHFRGTTPVAGQAVFDPYPRHLLGEVYASGDMDRFMADPYWTTGFVGNGPFRLEEWAQGSHLKFQAFDQYYLGRPKIDTVVLRFLGDANTLLANILSGHVDVAIPDGISVEQALTLKQGWAAPGTGNNVVLYSDGRAYWLEFQGRPEYAKPQGGLDPRVRAAIYRAIDKDGVIEVEVAALGPQADSWITPEDPDRPRYQAAGAIPEWSYDLQLAQRLLADAGWQKDPDGIFASRATGERLDLEVRVTNTAGHVKAASVIADGWRKIGVNATETVMPVSLNNNGEYRSTFPFASLSGAWVSHQWEANRFHCAAVASPANRWGNAGGRAGYCNPSLDPVIDRLQVTIAPQERVALRAQVMRQALAVDYGYEMLYWQVQPVVFAKGVTGFGALQPSVYGTTYSAWNAHLWDKTS